MHYLVKLLHYLVKLLHYLVKLLHEVGEVHVVFGNIFPLIWGRLGSKREDWDGSMQVSGLCSCVWKDALTFVDFR
jgi:hypothetical protein